VKPLRADDPQVVGRYQLIGSLGGGGMGRVYLARGAGGRTVAVKVIRPEYTDDPAFRIRFRREVEAARRVGGAWTAPVLDADPDAEDPYLVTAYIPGPSLSQAVTEHGPLPVRTVRALGAGLAEALIAVHRAGLVHRDLKPSNVLLSLDGPRVIDFGISRAVDASVLTRPGSPIGSPAFMSPEQVSGAEAGPASDVFSLGAVLVFAATGTGPFDGTIVAAVLHNVMTREPELAAVPAQLRELVRACLSKDPAARPSPAGVLAALAPGGDATTLVGGGWLPADLVAGLSRQAVALLDLDAPTIAFSGQTPGPTPPGGVGLPGNQPSGSGPQGAGFWGSGAPGGGGPAYGPGSASPAWGSGPGAPSTPWPRGGSAPPGAQAPPGTPPPGTPAPHQSPPPYQSPPGTPPPHLPPPPFRSPSGTPPPPFRSSSPGTPPPSFPPAPPSARPASQPRRNGLIVAAAASFLGVAVAILLVVLLVLPGSGGDDESGRAPTPSAAIMDVATDGPTQAGPSGFTLPSGPTQASGSDGPRASALPAGYVGTWEGTVTSSENLVSNVVITLRAGESGQVLGHGETTLLKALGVEVDPIKCTADLVFSGLAGPNGEDVIIVDVPGSGENPTVLGLQACTEGESVHLHLGTDGQLTYTSDAEDAGRPTGTLRRRT
jgi:serine/threonine protein kinase